MEYATLWRNEAQPGIELLKARYQQFEFAKHWHDELAIGIIEHGAEGLNYRGNNIVIPAQQIVAINPAEVHTGFSASEMGWQYRMFYFNTDLICNVLADNFETCQNAISPVINQPIIDDNALFTLLSQLHIALEQPSLALSKESLLTLVLTQLFTRYGQFNIKYPHTGQEQNTNHLIRDYLMAHWQDNVSLAQLVAISGLNQYRLIRSFTAQFAVTPHQFLLLVKISHAKKLLLNGSRCADVALECGFYDQSHFTRNFKRACGVAPKQYS
ncbi:AraC family transcriptional regulator [Pseudoalteromonas tunicata]|uniref:AraC family transcriptional regulator n=1 Tax=Pseudoalteromonas tunicata TaxID=314281 RepID=UPI00273D7FE5|nr:AraC family transcriptional regulator [Pseudoalteromonas tunicata]MDP5211470.1 AraC family transcriptional regulator [Pseudoalteromonas tunicata]